MSAVPFEPISLPDSGLQQSTKPSDRSHLVSCRVSGRPYEDLTPRLHSGLSYQARAQSEDLDSLRTLGLNPDNRPKRPLVFPPSCHPLKITPKSFHHSTRTVTQSQYPGSQTTTPPMPTQYKLSIRTHCAKHNTASIRAPSHVCVPCRSRPTNINIPNPENVLLLRSQSPRHASPTTLQYP